MAYGGEGCGVIVGISIKPRLKLQHPAHSVPSPCALPVFYSIPFVFVFVFVFPSSSRVNIVCVHSAVHKPMNKKLTTQPIFTHFLLIHSFTVKGCLNKLCLCKESSLQCDLYSAAFSAPAFLSWEDVLQQQDSWIVSVVHSMNEQQQIPGGLLTSLWLNTGGSVVISGIIRDCKRLDESFRILSGGGGWGDKKEMEGRKKRRDGLGLCVCVYYPLFYTRQEEVWGQSSEERLVLKLHQRSRGMIRNIFVLTLCESVLNPVPRHS